MMNVCVVLVKLATTTTKPVFGAWVLTQHRVVKMTVESLVSVENFKKNSTRQKGTKGFD